MEQHGIGGLIKLCCSVLHLLVLIVATPIAQKILNKTSVSLPAAVMYPCSTPFAELDSDTSIQIPGPFGADLQPYATTLSTEATDSAGRALKKQIGSSIFPEMKLKHGSNPVDFSTGVALSDTQTLLNDFIVPMFTENKTVKLFIDVENVTLKLFSFLRIPDLKMHKVLSCRATNTTQPKDIPSKYCNPSSEIASRMDTLDFMDLAWRRRLLGDSNQGYKIACTDTQNTQSISTIVV